MNFKLLVRLINQNKSQMMQYSTVKFRVMIPSSQYIVVWFKTSGTYTIWIF